VTGGAFAAARELLQAAVTARVFPGAAFEVGASGGPLGRASVGALTFEAGAPPVREETPYDLASLTKPMATTTIVLRLAARGALAIDSPVSRFFPDWRGDERSAVTVRDLLEHASGLPARLLDQPPEGRRAFEHDICGTPLEYAPRSRSIYSDLGFILLGFLAADVAGQSLARQFEEVCGGIDEATAADGRLRFAESPDRVPNAAPTMPLEDDRRRGRRLAGEVHDNYGAALGGVAGHTGLFGTAPAVGAFARAVLRAARGDRAAPAPFSPELVRLATTRSTVPGSSRALGWDTMLPTSSCGRLMASAAFGHVGFTGTSLWIDPERDRYFVLLANRVCGGGTTEEMQDVRRAFHDTLALM
jgi:CubicO group peptidase (beta-lactamase class C family)